MSTGAFTFTSGEVSSPAESLHPAAESFRRQFQMRAFLLEITRVDCELPRHRAAPIVAGEDGLIPAQMLDHGGNVSHQQPHVIVVDTLRLVGKIVAAHVDSDGLELARTRDPSEDAQPEVRY